MSYWLIENTSNFDFGPNKIGKFETYKQKNIIKIQ